MIDFAALLDDGLDAALHAVDLRTGCETGLRPDDVVVPASVFKIPVLVELCRQYSQGRLSPTQRVRLPADGLRTPGGTGFSIALDDVEVSLRDLAVSMIAVSDNRATDVVLGLVGLEHVNATMRALGHPATQLVGDCNHLFETIAADLDRDVAGLAELAPRDAAELLRHVRAATPGATTGTTPRETTALLAQLWGAAPAPGLDDAARAEARRVLGTQLWPQRIGSGFPEPEVRISGKTGTVGAWRTEAAVVEFGTDGSGSGPERYALAIFVTGSHAGPRDPIADAAIGRLARAAVDELRG